MIPPMNVSNIGEGDLAPVVPTGDAIPNGGDKKEYNKNEGTKKNGAEEALEKNEEFRKIHSFLQRENPVEFKIPELPKR
ncbi:hypothetical protein FACS189427_10670 [Planctomycetales bacterium]|nr:hypothetical protein FACS189427_10670 [Planctomycetales bacterium]